MLQKKVCMLGGFAVGKTSLVAQYVQGVFSDRYLSTVGVKIDRRDERVGESDVRLVLWDLAGQDEYQEVRDSYLRGASGFLFVVDPTRPETLDMALSLRTKAESASRGAPGLLLLNKVDRIDEWALTEADFERIELTGWAALRTSAMTGENVARAFQALAQRMIGE